MLVECLQVSSVEKKKEEEELVLLNHSGTLGLGLFKRTQRVQVCKG